MGAKVSEHGAPSVRRTVEGDWVVRNLLLVPHFAFPPSAIIKRPPLSSTARRAGWVGCNFALNRIPADARIEIVTTVIEKGRAVSPLTAEDLTFLRPAGDCGPYLPDFSRHARSASPYPATAKRTASPTWTGAARLFLIFSSNGFASPQKTSARNTAMGRRRQLVFYHYQLSASGEESTLSAGSGASGPGRRRPQPREIHLALPSLSSDAGSFARYYLFSTRAGHENGRFQLEEILIVEFRNKMAARFF